jgi:four helix bundle protein
MSSDSIAREKSKAFAVRIIRLYQYLCSEHREFVLSKQILRSGTSIGANITEAIYGSSRKDFIAKLRISLKECAETLYWLDLLYTCDFLSIKLYESLSQDCEELRRILSASIKSS